MKECQKLFWEEFIMKNKTIVLNMILKIDCFEWLMCLWEKARVCSVRRLSTSYKVPQHRSSHIDIIQNAKYWSITRWTSTSRNYIYIYIYIYIYLYINIYIYNICYIYMSIVYIHNIHTYKYINLYMYLVIFYILILNRIVLLSCLHKN